MEWSEGCDNISNCGNMPVLEKKQSQVGKVDHAKLVTHDDPH